MEALDALMIPFKKEFAYPGSGHILGHFRDLSTHQHGTVEWVLEGVETKLNPLNTPTGSVEQVIVALDECNSTVKKCAVLTP